LQIITDMLHSAVLGTPAWMWLCFMAIVAALLAFDLGVLHRQLRTIGVRESLLLSGGYIGIATLFGAGIWWTLGEAQGMAFFTGYTIEKSLSIDNVFVIATIFSSLAIPERYQHRVLFWGILGVLVLRAIMIAAGAALIAQFGWILVVFAAFLIVTGIKMWFAADDAPDMKSNVNLTLLRKRLRATSTVTSHAFFVRQPDRIRGRNVLWATPLFVALCLIEFADLIFAVDSVPAIFSITTDPFIVYTSNIFAILGLRALYFALQSMVGRFHYLKYSLALVLVFVGAKIILVELVGKIPASISLAVTSGLIGGGILLSLYRTRFDTPSTGATPGQE
jgi:tellurite resistance protein TerC